MGIAAAQMPSKLVEVPRCRSSPNYLRPRPINIVRSCMDHQAHLGRSLGWGTIDMVITSTIYSDNYHNITTNHINMKIWLNSINNSLLTMEVECTTSKLFCLKASSWGSSTGMSFNGTLDQWFVRGGYFNLFHFHIEMTWLHSIDQELQG